MDDVAECLANAESCLRMAIEARTEAMRAQVVELARHWTRLAAERENFVRAKAALKPSRTD